MKPIIDPQGLRLPIKLDTASNGEFEPVPLSPANHAGNRRARAAATENARRLGMSRRGFLVSACGAASTLLAFNAANAAVGKLGGFFELEPEAALEPRLAQARIGGKGEFIFDVQGHFVDPTGAWVKAAPPDAFKWSPKAGCALAGKPDARSHLNCLGHEEFVKDVFMDSDTDMMVLSFVPSRRDAEPLTIQAADAVRRIVDRMEGSHRLLIHGRVNPNQPGDLESMDESKERWKVSAWKTYTSGRGRQWILSVGRHRHTLHRKGARARRESDLRAQRIAFRQTVLRAQPVQRHRRGGEALSRRELSHLPLQFRHRSPGESVQRARRERRHRHFDSFSGGERRETEQQRIRGARQHLAFSHARAEQRGPRARQTHQVLRRK